MARRPNAYSQLIQEGQSTTQQEDTPPAVSGNTVKPQNRNEVKSAKTVKITIYPSQEQLDKLYDFMEAYRHKTGIKINQQDLIRRIIDVADVNTVLP
jgi:lipid II:glycine glycyltransferase (peptidoglycan interpeptide bridge formation enzyme)